jgi:hypothetical protein
MQGEVDIPQSHNKGQHALINRYTCWEHHNGGFLQTPGKNETAGVHIKRQIDAYIYTWMLAPTYTS